MHQARSHRGHILRLPPNRVWRTYSGGRMLDQIAGNPAPADGPFPEDWIGSTVRAVNPGRGCPDEGLSRVQFSGTTAVLADLIAADPEYFLGAQHVARHGASPMLLVKYLDSAVRLPFQVHPTVEFARERLRSDSGKTEAYYILDVRPETAAPFIYLGFQRPPTRAQLRQMIAGQDIAALERCFDPIPVKPGDIFVVPGGLPHAIGPGLLMVEIMEPTDFVARIEFQAGGRAIPESARFMGRDIDFALDMFGYDELPVASIASRCGCEPSPIENTAGLRRESLVDGRVTDRFRVLRAALAGGARWRVRGFSILLVLDGACAITANGERADLVKYDRVIVPWGMEDFDVTAREGAVLLECRPPRAGDE